jgi:hypothetical protein
MREGRAEAARAEARDGYIPKQSQHFQWLRFAAAWADQQDQAKPAAIYFRTTMLPPDFNKPGRGGADDAHALAFLWADLDYGTVGHKPPPGATLPPDEESARKIIADLRTPFLIIHSGGGLSLKSFVSSHRLETYVSKGFTMSAPPR